MLQQNSKITVLRSRAVHNATRPLNIVGLAALCEPFSDPMRARKNGKNLGRECIPATTFATYHRFNNRRRYLVIARIVVDTRCRLVVTKLVAAGRMGRRCRHVLPRGVVGRALQGNVRSPKRLEYARSACRGS